MEWKYKMFINDIYWKGYSACPTIQQKETEKRSFINSEYNTCGKLEMVIKISK